MTATGVRDDVSIMLIKLKMWTLLPEACILSRDK